MERNGLRSLAGLLLYGDPGSTERVAQALVARNDPHIWELLVGTIQADDEELPVRIRCLDVLAKAATSARGETARQIFAAFGHAGST